MVLFVACLTGFLGGRLLWTGLRPAFAAPFFLRQNYRGLEIPTGGGAILALALLVVEGARVAAGAAGTGPRDIAGTRLMVVAAAVGLCFLGLFDDLAATGSDRGFGGHLRALARGRLTTGGLKLLGGGALALVVVSAARPSRGMLVADALLVALAANLGNLFDRAPGRAIKSAVFAFVLLAVGTRAAVALSGPAVVVGAALALALDDLHERVMLGDAGANVLGGVIGLGVVVSCSPAVRVGALVVAGALNLASEVVSFSRVIDRVGPLRALDRAGRRA